MSYQAYEDSFCLYAMELFFRAGHVFTSTPEFANHSPERFVFFDCQREISYSRDQRTLLKSFNNVSRLFSVNGCVFFSINLYTTKKERSQSAHDIHTMIHPGVGSKGTICLFKHEDEVMLSFMGFGLRCILSDWYPLDDDYDTLLNKLDISNMSLDHASSYFSDMIYYLAREYYFISNNPQIYDLIPTNYFLDNAPEETDRDELDQMILYELLKPQRDYGDDYVEYDESVTSQETSISSDLDLMLLQISETDEDLGNPFGEEIDADNEDENEDDNEQDEYEFSDVDPEIFRDPALMVKWLQRNDHK